MSTDPDQIRSEIDQTQRELSADVDALTEKLSPQRMVERRVRRSRTAVTNVKDRIMGSTSDAYQTPGSTASDVGESVSARASAARDTVVGTASSAVDTVRSAPDTARRSTQGNPLAAGLIAQGYTYKEIAKELFISTKTVESHVSSVLRKLQLSTRHQLTRWAAERRLA